jgi:hypothetical protein
VSANHWIWLIHSVTSSIKLTFGARSLPPDALEFIRSQARRHLLAATG